MVNGLVAMAQRRSSWIKSVWNGSHQCLYCSCVTWDCAPDDAKMVFLAAAADLIPPAPVRPALQDQGAWTGNDLSLPPPDPNQLRSSSLLAASTSPEVSPWAQPYAPHQWRAVPQGRSLLHHGLPRRLACPATAPGEPRPCHGHRGGPQPWAGCVLHPPRSDRRSAQGPTGLAVSCHSCWRSGRRPPATRAGGNPRVQSGSLHPPHQCARRPRRRSSFPAGRPGRPMGCRSRVRPPAAGQICCQI